MTKVHKYFDYGASVAVVVGLQCLFAPTRGIPYYAIGAGVSYLAIDPLAERLMEHVLGCLNNEQWLSASEGLSEKASDSDPELMENLVKENIYRVQAGIRLYFADYILRQSISAYMGSHGCGGNFARALTHSAINLAANVQESYLYEDDNIELTQSRSYIMATHMMVTFAKYYFEHKIENLHKVFLCILLGKFVLSCANEYLNAKETADSNGAKTVPLSSTAISSLKTAIIDIACVGIVISIGLDSESGLAKIVNDFIYTNVDCLLQEYAPDLAP